MPTHAQIDRVYKTIDRAGPKGYCTTHFEGRKSLTIREVRECVRLLQADGRIKPLAGNPDWSVSVAALNREADFNAEASRRGLYRRRSIPVLGRANCTR